MKKKSKQPDHFTRLVYLLGVIIVMPALLIERLHDVWWGIESQQALRQDATAFFVMIAFCVLAIYAKWLSKIHRAEKREKIQSTMSVIELWSQGIRRRFGKWVKNHLPTRAKSMLMKNHAAVVALESNGNIEVIADDLNQITIFKNGKELCSIPRLDINSDKAKGQ